MKNNYTIPVVYALLPDKRAETYGRLFAQIKAMVPNLQVSTITSDFELATITAVKEEFSRASHYGCLFHLGQCLYRKICDCGLKVRYDTDSDFALRIRMLLALAFVPVDKVTESFEALLDSDIYPSIVNPILDYFEDSWIGRPSRRHRRSPLFEISMWSCFERVNTDLPRTNNALEGWHRAFLQQMSSHHPTIWKFLDALKREQDLRDIHIAKIRAGSTNMKSSKKYRDLDERLKKLVATFDEYTLLQYLRAVAHNLRL